MHCGGFSPNQADLIPVYKKKKVIIRMAMELGDKIQPTVMPCGKIMECLVSNRTN